MRRYAAERGEEDAENHCCTRGRVSSSPRAGLRTTDAGAAAPGYGDIVVALGSGRGEIADPQRENLIATEQERFPKILEVDQRVQKQSALGLP